MCCSGRQCSTPTRCYPPRSAPRLGPRPGGGARGSQSVVVVGVGRGCGDADVGDVCDRGWAVGVDRGVVAEFAETAFTPSCFEQAAAGRQEGVGRLLAAIAIVPGVP